MIEQPWHQAGRGGTKGAVREWQRQRTTTWKPDQRSMKEAVGEEMPSPADPKIQNELKRNGAPHHKPQGRQQVHLGDTKDADKPPTAGATHKSSNDPHRRKVASGKANASNDEFQNEEKPTKPTPDRTLKSTKTIHDVGSAASGPHRASCWLTAGSAPKEHGPTVRRFQGKRKSNS